MAGSYYPYFVKANNNDYILIWFNDGAKDVFLKLNREIYKASSRKIVENELPDIAPFIIWDDVNVKLDLDVFLVKLQNIKVNEFLDQDTCEKVLEIWNFCDDFMHTLENSDLSTDSAVLNKMYKKIFFGNNLDAVTPKGENYNPVLEKSELLDFINIMTKILNLVFSKLK